MSDEKKPFSWVPGVEAQMRKELLGQEDPTDIVHLQRCILAAADALIQRDIDEAYHQLYRAIEPTFTKTGDPFERLRAELAARG